jgi:hypothetical protein
VYEEDNFATDPTTKPPRQTRPAAAPSVRIVGADRLTLHSGQPLQLRCEAAGSPEPRLTWTNGHGELLAEQTATFGVAAVGADHAGYYVCTAENAAGARRAYVYLEVVAPLELEAVCHYVLL